jgi:hypothetical protein
MYFIFKKQASITTRLIARQPLILCRIIIQEIHGTTLTAMDISPICIMAFYIKIYREVRILYIFTLVLKESKGQ